MNITLRKGARGVQVVKLQKLLNSLHVTSKKLVEDGIFGNDTFLAVIAFQRTATLKPDGVVGSRTWSGLSSASSKQKIIPFKPQSSPQAKLAEIASKYIGVKETGNNLAGKSKILLEIFNADNLAPHGKTDGYPWCASFVSFCVQKLVATSEYYRDLTPPREASVSHFLNVWAKSNGCAIFTNKSSGFQPQKGDIVVFIFSHIGIIESVNQSFVRTIEGNTNDSGSREGNIVARKNRTKSLIKAYIRLPVSSTKVLDVIDKIVRMC